MSRAAILCVALAVIGLSLAEDKYTDRYDNVDVSSILTNERLYQLYFDCLLNGGGKCPEDVKALKGRLPEALETDCAKCTEKQVAIIKEVISFLKKNHPEDYDKLTKKFDPEGKYAAKHPEI